DAAFTELVRAFLAGRGYDVKVNDPYKGVELVRAYSKPAARRHSLQLEINKKLYMDEATREQSAGFAPLQQHLAELVDTVLEYTRGELRGVMAPEPHRVQRATR
ncbi:MAG: N-formylglutamate amidohydrolase, partial [Caldimonas sp.]